MSKLSILCVLLNVSILHAQNFIGEANITPVNKDGFYRISIRPEHSKYLTSYFANLRVTDNAGQTVPYIIETDRDYSTFSFEEYSIESKIQEPGCCTTIVIKNTASDSINNIYLQIKNADVEKQATLLGSDDKKHWFGLKNRFYLTRINNLSNTSEIRVVDFPFVDYKFLKIEIEDSTSAPLNIQAIGFYKDFTRYGKYNMIKDVNVNIDSDNKEKETYIRFKLDTLQWLDRIQFIASGSPFFLRKVTLYDIVYLKRKKGGWYESRQYLNEITVNQNSTAVFDIPNTRSKELLAVVENDDNPPLRFDSIQALQLNRYLVAYLEKNKTYKFKVASEETERPVYDLNLFRDKIAVELPIVYPDDIIIYNANKQAPSESFFTRSFMWFAIVTMIVLLGAFSIKMIREMKV
jgi:hypothetical protein